MAGKGCPKGYTWDGKRKVCLAVKAGGGHNCPGGTTYSDFYKGCIPLETTPDAKVPVSQPPDESLSDECPPGTHKGPFGACVPDTQQPAPELAPITCPPGFVAKKTWNAWVCVSEETAGTQPVGQPPPPGFGPCPDPNQYRDEAGNCVDKVTGDPCGTGNHIDPVTGQCVADYEDPCGGLGANWSFNPTTGLCEEKKEEEKEKEEEVDVKAQGDLRAVLTSILDQFGLATPGLIALIEQAVREDWSETKFLQEMRKHPDYLSNPLFAANIEAAAGGRRFRSEAEVLAEADAIRTLIKKYGFGDVPDSYIAANILSGKSLAEIDHLLTIQKQVEIYGPVFKGFVEQELGIILGDDDLFEIFDPERNTQEFDDAFRAALYRARPFTLGLGIRSEAEMRALEMLGVDPEEAFTRYESIGKTLPTFNKFAAIESIIGTGNLPADFGAFFGAAENSVLTKAFLFPGTPEGNAALAELQQMFAREFARFSVGGGPALAQGGQAIGLLTPNERAAL